MPARPSSSGCPGVSRACAEASRPEPHLPGDRLLAVVPEDAAEVRSVTVANEQYLPTQMAIAERIRFNRPVTARLQPASGMTVLTGNIQQQVPRLEGMGGRSKFSWLVQAQAGTRVNLEVFAERAGGLQSVPLTLR